MSNRAAFITNVSAFLPNAAVNNDEMESVLGQVGTRPSRARRMVLRSNGIRQRHYAIEPQSRQANYSNAQLAAEALRALEDEVFQLDQLGCLVAGSSIPDQLMPNHAVMVHGELANPACEVIGTAGVCLSGITALKYAYLSVLAGEHRFAAASGSERASAMMRAENFEGELAERVEQLERQPEIAFEKDFLRWMLSDGAGAVLIEPQPRADALSLRIDWIEVQSYAHEMDACMYAGAEKLADGSLQGWSQYSDEQRRQRSIMAVKQDVKQLNDNIVHYTVERPLKCLRDKRALDAARIDHFLPHYSSEFFRDRLAEGLRRVGFDLPQERWFTNLRDKGNTGSASIYIILEELFRSGRLQRGQRILCYVPESGRFSSAYMHLTVV